MENPIGMKCSIAAQQVVDTGPLQAQHCAAADQQKCGDRLTALHSRLHQEADKIRKWKTATDIELRQKVCVIH